MNLISFFLKSVKAREKFGSSFVPLKNKHEQKKNFDIEADIKYFCHSQEAVYHMKVYHVEPTRDGRNYSNLILIKARKIIAEQMKEEFDDNLYGCLCEGCHTNCFRWTRSFMGAFPQHVNTHQFFTPKMFRNYRTLGFKTSSLYFGERSRFF